MQDLGFSDRRSLVIILGTHSSVALIGLVLHRAATPEYYQFAIFVGCFGLYALLTSQLWLTATKLQDTQSRLAAAYELDTNAAKSGVEGYAENKDSPTLGSTSVTKIKRR